MYIILVLFVYVPPSVTSLGGKWCYHTPCETALQELEMLYLCPSSLAPLSEEESGVTTLLVWEQGREGRDGGGNPNPRLIFI